MNKIKSFFAIVCIAVVNASKAVKRAIVNAFNAVKKVIVNVFTNPRTQKIAVVGVVFLVVGICPAMADGISNGLTQISKDFENYIDPVRNIIYAIAAICAVVGSFTIYFKMTNGDQDVKKTIMLTVGGVAGLMTLATVLPSILKTTT